MSLKTIFKETIEGKRDSLGFPKRHKIIPDGPEGSGILICKEEETDYEQHLDFEGNPEGSVYCRTCGEEVSFLFEGYDPD